jgi:DNA-directed RNA polymerase specialized sigma24 family protein
MPPTDNLSITELAQRCQEENHTHRQHKEHERGYCYELFRRAISTGSQQAWEALYAQYQHLMTTWIWGKPELTTIRINGAWARFWHALAKTDFSRKFASIGKVIAFLRLCVHSECIDEQRREVKHQQVVCLDESIEEITLHNEDTTALAALDNVLRQELFTYIDEQVQDPKERLVLHLSFEVGWMPRQIAQQHADIFRDVTEVRRIKERVVLRLSNDQQLQNWWKNAIHLGK